MKPTTKYFDAKKVIACYEFDSGESVSKESAKLIIAFESVINRAYADGFRAGQEAVHG